MSKNNSSKRLVSISTCLVLLIGLLLPSGAQAAKVRVQNITPQLTASDQNGSEVSLQWSIPENVRLSGFELERSSDPLSGYSVVRTPGVNASTRVLPTDQAYYYRIRAYYEGRRRIIYSSYSNIVFADISADTPQESVATGSFEFSEAACSVGENDGQVNITIKRVGGSAGAATVDWRTNGITASFGSDYDSFSWTTLSFADGETSKVKSIVVNDDNILEGNETFSVSLANPTGGTALGAMTMSMVTIADDEVDAPASDVTAPTVSITSPSVDAAYSSDQTVSIVASAQDDLGVTKVEFYDGSTLIGTDTTNTYSVSMPISEADNGSHNITAKAYDAAGNVATSSSVTLTVDIAPPAPTAPGSFEFKNATYSVGENAGQVNVTINRVGGSTGAATVDWRTNGITASFGSDYDSFSWTTLDFADGETSKVKSIVINNDALFEGNETFKATLANPTGGTSLGATTVSTVTIIDDEEEGPAPAPATDETAPTVSITSPSVNTTYNSSQTVTIVASAQDDTAVSKVEFYDGSTLIKTDTTNTYSASMTISEATNGSHNITAKAYDAAGNVATSTSVTLTVDIVSTDPGPAPDGPLTVFPGAKGFGVETPAGRGGQIIKVTNLNNSGSGSLRAALQASGPRTVVFEVSGTISLADHIKVLNPYLTIAGQTAPFPGIALKGAGIILETHDVLIQHIRIRPGDDPNGPDPSNRDALQILEGNAYNIVVDHISVSWAIDENIGSGYGMHDVTISNSIIAEGLSHSLHSEPEHSKGILIADNSLNIALIGNLFAHNRERLPRVKADVSLLMVNNLIYNGLNYLSMGSSIPSWVSAVGNVFVNGPNSSESKAAFQIREGTSSDTELYLSDNVTSGPLLRNYGTNDPLVSKAPIWIPSLPVLHSSEVEDSVLPVAGARPAERDSADERVVNEVASRSGYFVDSPTDVGGWPSLGQNYRSFPVPANPSGDDDGDGYTNLEEVLHQMAAQVEGAL